MLSALLVTLLIVAFTAWWYLIRVCPDDLVLKVGAGPYRSDSYELMREVAEVVERHGTGVRLEVVCNNRFQSEYLIAQSWKN